MVDRFQGMFRPRPKKSPLVPGSDDMSRRPAAEMGVSYWHESSVLLMICMIPDKSFKA